MWMRTKDFLKNHLVTLVMAAAMIVALGYLQTRDSYGYEFTSNRRVRVDVRPASDSWKRLSQLYSHKTGSTLTQKSIEERIKDKNDVSLEDEVPINDMLANPDRILFRKYTFSGTIISKVRIVDRGIDYALIRTPSGTIRVYYFSDLPYQDMNTKVVVTGIVLGRPYEKQGDLVSFVSESYYTKTAPGIGKKLIP